MSASKRKDKIFPKYNFSNLKSSHIFVCPSCLRKCPCFKCMSDPLIKDIFSIKKDIHKSEEVKNTDSKKRDVKKVAKMRKVKEEE